MTDVNEIKTDLAELKVALTDTDAKLDEIAAFIAALKAGVISQEQLDELGGLVKEAKGIAQKNLTETDDLDQ